MRDQIAAAFGSSFKVVPLPVAAEWLSPALVLGAAVGLGCGVGNIALAALATVIVVVAVGLLRGVSKGLAD